MKQLPIYGADEGVHKTMDEVEQVMENMDLQPDPEVTKYLFGLFSKEALWSYAGIAVCTVSIWTYSPTAY